MATQKKKTKDEKKQTTAALKAESQSAQTASSSSRKAAESGTKKAASTQTSAKTAKSNAASKTPADTAGKKPASKSVKNNQTETPEKITHTSAVSEVKSKKTASAEARSDSQAAKKEDRAEIVYQPEFEKSVLDQPGQHNGPVYRYSDAELQEFKEIILKKLEAARKELAYLQGLITRKDEMGTEDTENKYMSMEDGSGTLEREQLNQMASRQIQFIDHLEKALVRIENKTYGICRVTGKLIDKARLRAVPHATLSIEAKKALSKGS